VISKSSSESADEWIIPYDEIKPGESASRRESPDLRGARRGVRGRPGILPPSPGRSSNESDVEIRNPRRRPVPYRLSSPPLNPIPFGPPIPRIPYGGYPSYYDRPYGPSVPPLPPVPRRLSSPLPNLGGSSNESEGEIRIPRRRTIPRRLSISPPSPNPFAPRAAYVDYPSYDPYYGPSMHQLQPTAYYPYMPEPLSKAYSRFPPAPPPSVDGTKGIPKLSLKCKIGTRPSNGAPVFSEYNFSLRGEFSLKNYIKSIDYRDPVIM
jgi:hypothetical protein